jgi:hypothetical protein
VNPYDQREADARSEAASDGPAAAGLPVRFSMFTFRFHVQLNAKRF